MTGCLPSKPLINGVINTAGTGSKIDSIEEAQGTVTFLEDYYIYMLS